MFVVELPRDSNLTCNGWFRIIDAVLYSFALLWICMFYEISVAVFYRESEAMIY